MRSQNQNTRTRTVQGLAFLLALGLVAASCSGSSGSDDGSASGDGTVVTSTAPGTDLDSESDGEQAEQAETLDDETDDALVEAGADGYLAGRRCSCIYRCIRVSQKQLVPIHRRNKGTIPDRFGRSGLGVHHCLQWTHHVHWH